MSFLLTVMDAGNFVSPWELLTNYTYRNMVVGTTLIGAASGSLGCFLYLRKQSLISDVIGHSAVLGVMVSFLVATALLGIDGRSMVVLTIGSVVAATISVLLANWIAADTRIGIDAAMAICLSLFYGGGMVVMRLINKSSLPNRGGIDKYMFGNAATMLLSDIVTIAIFGGAAIVLMVVFWKEFKVFTFDPVLAATMGFSGKVLGPLLLGTITVAVVIGVKAVGLILMVAFAIMPAASARQWTKHLSTMVGLATVIGAGSAVFGSYLSVNLGKVPPGPVVVLVLFTVFLFSILFAPQRSVLRRRLVRQRKIRQLREVAQGRGIEFPEDVAVVASAQVVSAR